MVARGVRVRGRVGIAIAIAIASRGRRRSTGRGEGEREKGGNFGSLAPHPFSLSTPRKPYNNRNVCLYVCDT